MRLTVLGGAAACPGPGQGSSSYLLELQSQRWLLDCGPDTLLELRKHIEIDSIDHIFISHVHADHTLDLVPLRYGLKYDPGVHQAAPALHMPPGGCEFLGRVADAFAMGTEEPETFFGDSFDVSEYDPGQKLTIGTSHVRFLRTNHPVPCWAMRIASPGGTLVYLADTGPQDDLVEFAREADILICEGTYLTLADAPDSNDRPHITAREAGEIARDAKVRRFVLTHLWSTEGLARYAEEAKSGFGGPVIVAKPGTQVTAF